ncbi:MAG: phosphodiester glycosidase family protein [Pedobacter sp.]|nr:MAG: phosphodiester glycosidase family protein [Pedobacter sp.]
MIKRSIPLFVLFSASLVVFAQNKDSVAVVNAAWKSTSLANNVVLKTHHFHEKELFSANQNISFLELIPKKHEAAFDLGYEKQVLRTTSDFAQEKGALAAVNGSFFDVKNGGSVDFLKYRDSIITANRLEKGGFRARHQRAAIAINKGKLIIERWNGKSDWEQRLNAPNILLSGPMLTFKGKDQELDTTSFTKARHPRSAVGIKKNGHIILLTVDGRNDQSAGMSLEELKNTLRWLGCTTALNLDGGGSTTLWAAGVGNNGVVNFPSDNKLWDHEGQRKVANVLLITKKP